jgi:hypothetical protein
MRQTREKKSLSVYIEVNTLVHGSMTVAITLSFSGIAGSTPPQPPHCAPSLPLQALLRRPPQPLVHRKSFKLVVTVLQAIVLPLQLPDLLDATTRSPASNP